MKDRYAAQRATQPLRIVLLKFGVHRFQKWADEGHLECGADDRAFVENIHHCKIN
jgi:hypothetical protein